MAIGETILGAVLQVLLDKLMSPEVISFFKRSKFDNSIVDKLLSLMSAAEKLLIDAEQKQMTDDTVKRWLGHLKHWVYRAEEVVGEIATEALQSSLQSPPPELPADRSFGSKVWSFLPSSSKSSSFEKTVVPKIKEVVNMLDTIVKQGVSLQLKEVSVATIGSQITPHTRQTTYLLEDSVVHGRDQEKNKILDFVLSKEYKSNQSIGVIVIMGMGGLGKTTLAKLVYNDAKLKNVFDLKVWVCVSDQFDILRVTKSILESISGQSDIGSSDLNSLQHKLSRQLKDKKFLMVLDDVWHENYEDWKSLRAPFKVGASGSKIIVTTRNDGVASIMRTTPVFRLTPLSEEDGWSLFSTHAFELGNPIDDEKHQLIGREIVKKCRGLPLAIKTLGGLLRSAHEISEWKMVLDSSIWDLPRDKSNIIPALMLSYHHLPPHLKRCFSYCAIFPKDHKIDIKQLVLLWMAEGFVNEKKRRMEDLGEQYLHQLLSRSFFETNKDERYVMMHDLMHDLAQVLCGEFLARREFDGPLRISDRARHFSYLPYSYDGTDKFEFLREINCLRTFLQ